MKSHNSETPKFSEPKNCEIDLPSFDLDVDMNSIFCDTQIVLDLALDLEDDYENNTSNPDTEALSYQAFSAISNDDSAPSAADNFADRYSIVSDKDVSESSRKRFAKSTENNYIYILEILQISSN